MARGAAMHAEKFAGSRSEEIDLLTDKVRVTLGIRAIGESSEPKMAPVISGKIKGLNWTDKRIQYSARRSRNRDDTNQKQIFTNEKI